MAIRDSNGNVYKLRGPNPLMKEQEFWDKDKITFINMTFKEDVVNDSQNKTTLKTVLQQTKPVVENSIENFIDIEAPVSEPLPVVEPEPIQEPDPTPIPVKIKAPKPKSDRSTTSGEEPNIYSDEQYPKIQKAKILIHCLPIYDKEVKDEMYGDVYKIQTYGDKFTFEGVMVDEDDLYCQFWTTTNIPTRSVIYPKNHSRRWWQVQSVELFDGGYMVNASPTHANPDFTD